MELFREVIEGLKFVSIGLLLVKCYLNLNKLWKRRHNREVTESISIVALLITYATVIPFFVDRVIKGEVKAAVLSAGAQT